MIIFRAKRSWLSLLGASSALLFLSAAAHVAEKGTNAVEVNRLLGVEEPEAFVDDELIVILSREARARVRVNEDRSNRPIANLASLQAVFEQHGVETFRRQFPTARPRPVDSPYPDLTGHFKVKLGNGIDLETAMAAFARNPHVERVEPIGVHSLYLEPNDPFYRDSPDPNFDFDQWHYFDRDPENFSIQADLAWDTEAGDSATIVAVADSGVRYFHRDLGGTDPPGPNDNGTNGNVWVNPGEIPGDGVDNDLNGYVDDVVGYDFVESAPGGFGCNCCDSDCDSVDNDPRDDNGHGTHVSGTVTAVTNNARAGAGVSGGVSDGTTDGAGNGARVMALRIGWNAKCFGQCGFGFVRMDYAAEAMVYVADQVERGVNIVAFNASWGSSNSGGLEAAVDNLLAHDVMLVHAAGNDGSNNPDFLGNKAGVLNVAATDRNGAGASFTNHGSWVDLAAPGVDVLSTWHQFSDPSNDYIAVLSGTSMAAPHVCGVAALLESCAPTLSGPDKFQLLVSNVRPYADTRDLGSGILNAKLALDAAGTCTAGCVTDADCDDGDACNGAETCMSGTCQSGVSVDCDDDDACTADTCDPATGTCAHDPISCDDGDACTVDSCDPASGCVNEPVNCDDGDACTTDSCDPSTGSCVNDPISCDDGIACTADSCDPATGCENTFPACGASDGCCGPECDASTDPDCSAAVCGDKICEGNGEDCHSCRSDCRCAGPDCSKGCCGDGVCFGENANNCPADCGG